MEPITRVCLNAHHGVTNVVDHKDLREVIIPTLDLFITQLTRICGPYARNALIIKADETLGTAMGSEMDMRMFLRDGRHIIKSTEFISPIQQYLKTMVLYIGSRVDAICKDGTTTSMLFTCHFLKRLVYKSDDFVNYTLNEIETAFDEILKVIEVEFKKQIITPDAIVERYGCTKNEAASALAFLQAYTASGCDTEIAIAIAEFFRKMPSEIWSDRIDHTISRVEKTGYKCKADVCDAEYELKSMLLTTQYRNTDMRRSVELEETDVLIMPDGIHDASLGTTELVEYLQKRLEVDKNTTPLVICTPGGDHCSPRMVESINAKAKVYGVKIPIVAYNTQTRSPLPWNALAICGKANVPLYQEASILEDSVIHGVHVCITNNATQFNKLTPTDERVDPNVTLVHPGVLYPEDYPHHKKAMDIVDGYLTTAKTSHRIEDNEIVELETAHADLSVRVRMLLRLGGYYHDQMALQPVIEDAGGSAMAAVRDGVVTNGMSRLFTVSLEIFKQYLAKYNDEIACKLLGIFNDAANDTCKCLYGPYIPNDEFKEWVSAHYPVMAKDSFHYVDIVDLDRNTNSMLKDEFRIKDLSQDIEHLVNGNYSEVIEAWKKNGYPPIQTVGMTTELSARLKEVALRVGLTDMIVVPGAAWTIRDKSA